MPSLQVNCGFREPYKVFLDGNLIHNVLALGRGTVASQVEALMGGKTRLLTTRCVQAELASLGPDLAPALAASRAECALARCGHGPEADRPCPRVPAASCLRSLIGDDNRDHLWIGTQDRGLRRALAGIPGAPSLFLSAAGLMLEPPSAQQVRHAGDADRASRAAGVGERKAAAEADAERGDGGEVGGRGATQPRRRKAKGPNPLANRKKKPPKPRRPPLSDGSR